MRLAGTAEVAGVLMAFGGILAGLYGGVVVADTSLERAEQTLAFLAVIAGATLLIGMGVALRALAILLRRSHDDP